MRDMISSPCTHRTTHSYNYYDIFHRGEAVGGFFLAEMFGDDSAYRSLPVPRQSTVPQVTLPENVQREPYHTLEPFAEDEDERARQLEALQDGTHPTTQALVPLGMRFLKILGIGSQGTAALFEVDDENNAARKIVAKYHTPTEENNTDLREEKGRLRVSKG